MSVKYGSGKGKFVGQSLVYPFPIPLDATQHNGAVIVAEDGQLYYSNGSDWVIPSEVVEISRPSARVPTNSMEQTQLRLSAFRSPAGLSQVGILFEISMNGVDFVDAETRLVNDEFASLYQLLYPEDGFESGDEIFWRGKYIGTEGGQSDFSIPFRQTFPKLIDDPMPVTRQGAVTGTVELSPFFSALGLDYVETQIQFWEDTANPAVDPPVATVTSVSGALINLPTQLVEGQAYQWSGRYGGRQGGAGPILYTAFTAPRFILKGVASMILIYDPALALNRTINLPMGVYGGIVNVNVDWGDGTSNAYTTGGIRSKTYAAGVTGLVTVIISGQLEQFGGNTNIQGLIRVDNIGVGLGLNSLREMFRNVTSNTIFCTPNIPPTVKSIQGMFFNAGTVTFDVTGFTVGEVKDFTECFLNAGSFNQNISGWDVSNANSMRGMFRTTITGLDYVFNQPIGSWDVSSVTDMSFMFSRNATNSDYFFNQNIGGWDVSSVTNMFQMFGASLVGTDRPHLFNNGGTDSIKNWDVSSVTNMSRMFFGSGGQFQQPIADWDVSSVTNFRGMFDRSLFNQPLTGWNISAAIDVREMFANSPFNNDVSNWVLPANIQALFQSAKSFNHLSILSWDTSGVTNMSRLFMDADAFNQPIGSWNTFNVTTMEEMFFPATINTRMKFNRPVENWDVSKVISMKRMFGGSGSSDFNQPIAAWDVSKVEDFSEMFFCSNPTRPNNFDQDISDWKLNTQSALINAMFGGPGSNFSAENYSKLLVGWSNSIIELNGPFGVLAGFGDRTYNDTDYFVGELYENAVAARAYLSNSNRLTVSDAGNANADGNYLFDGTVQLYANGNDWYFIKTSGVWELRDNLDAVQATQQDVGNLAAPQLVDSWNGDLATATVLRTGAAWTITDGGLAA